MHGAKRPALGCLTFSAPSLHVDGFVSDSKKKRNRLAAARESRPVWICACILFAIFVAFCLWFALVRVPQRNKYCEENPGECTATTGGGPVSQMKRSRETYSRSHTLACSLRPCLPLLALLRPSPYPCPRPRPILAHCTDNSEACKQPTV